METISTSAARVLAQAEGALVRLERLKTFLLMTADLDATDHIKWHFLTQESRASCIVGVLAELEALTRLFLCETNKQINHGMHEVSSLQACVRGLAGHEHFESLRTSADSSNIWSRRALLTTYDSGSEVAKLPIPTRGPQPPLDGKTLTPAHFSRVWVVYGIAGDAIPDLRWGQTLQKLSGLRNDIAHANLPFQEIFETAGTQTKDIERYVEEMQQFIIHLADSWSEYGQGNYYLAANNV